MFISQDTYKMKHSTSVNKYKTKRDNFYKRKCDSVIIKEMGIFNWNAFCTQAGGHTGWNWGPCIFLAPRVTHYHPFRKHHWKHCKSGFSNGPMNFLKVLLRWKSHKTKFTTVKCVILWHLVYSRCWATITYTELWNTFILPEENPGLFKPTLHVPPLHHPLAVTSMFMPKDLPILNISWK